MKTSIVKILCVLLVAASALTMAAAPARHQPRVTHFLGTEQFTGFPDPQPGTIKEVGGKTIAKGLVIYFVDSESDPRVSGDVTANVNYVYNGPPIFGTGPIWGTETITNSEGKWSVSFIGYQGVNCQTNIHAWGKGGGQYEGLTAVWDITSNSCGLAATVSGSIIEHD